RDGPVFVSLCHWSAPLPWLTMGSHHRLLCPLGVCWRSGADHSITGGIGAEGDKAWLRQRLLQLLTLFRQRNDLAHGRIAEDVAVERVYDLLCRIREKWCAAVPDFRGF
ncbi:hypothetical protein, partial [Lamprobacter modestohalophilus]|uniref:hypothetical protein n=1 Tax=Lamprobacter modestohalophilus TaxID=1064514 RepID=UPI001A90DC67